MDTIAAIINSLPEPLATAILTATFTGLVIFFLQKRVENSFAKKLEEFKANLQLSNFEQQTKFVKLHEKKVEVLETLYRMFLPIPTEYNNYTIEELYSYSENIPLLESIQKQRSSPVNVENLRVKLDEFWNYFVSNRVFFSDKTIDEIEGIYRKTQALIKIVPSYVLLLLNFGDFGTEVIHDIDKELKTLDLKITQIDKKEDFLVFVHELADEMKRQAKKLEKLYRSVGVRAEEE